MRSKNINIRNNNINIFGELGKLSTESLRTTAMTGLKLLTVFAALGFWLLLFDSPALAGSLSTTFTNDTGQVAYDLHIKYVREVKVVQTPKTFDKVDDGKNAVNLSGGGNVAIGGSIEIEATGNGDVKINEWWWTDINHKKIPFNYVVADSSNAIDTATISGVVTVEMKTDNGQQVNLTLPADMRPGDTISLSAETQNSDTLNGAVFDIGGKEYKLRNRILTFVVPAAAGVALPIILKNSAGREIGRKQIPINKNPGSIPTQLGNVAQSRIGQTGQIVPILRQFDGNAENTRAAFTPNVPQSAQTDLPVVAESPRGTFVKVPSNAPTGAGTMTIEDLGISEQFKFNVLKIVLLADELSLPRGKTTTLHAEIIGMEGLAEDKREVILNLKNLSPSVVRFNSTSSDNITTKVTPNNKGVATFNETLTGINAGAFTIRGLLRLLEDKDEPETPRDWLRRIAELKREAANLSENKKNKAELVKNADDLDEFADDDSKWMYSDGYPAMGAEKFKDFLKKEKEALDKMQKRENQGGPAATKIGEAKDAVDKADKATEPPLK